jgi:hypothetical protein
LSANSKLYGTVEIKDNFLSMRQAKPLFLDLRGFSSVKVERNHIETVEGQANLVRITDCQSVRLQPQRMAGTKDDPQAQLVRVENRDSKGWNVK